MSGLTKDELRKLIKETVSGAVVEHVDSALKPLLKQHTNWMDQLMGKAAPVGASNGSALSAPFIRTHKGKESPLGKAIIALHHGNGRQEEAHRWASKTFGSSDSCVKSLFAGDFTGAGALLKDDVLEDLEDRLRVRSILRQMGMTSVSAPWGSKDLPVLSSSCSAAFSAEGTEIVASKLQVERRRLDPKRLGCLSLISRELMQWTGGTGLSAEQIIADDMAKEISTAESTAILYTGTGLVNQPLSLFNQVKAAQLFNANGTVNLANVTVDLFQLLTSAGENDTNTGSVFVMTQRSWLYLNSVRGTTGEPGFSSNLLSHSNPRVGEPVGTLYGQPVWTTNGLPNDLGAGSDESVILFFAPEDIWLGNWDGVEIVTSQDATVVDEDDNTINLFSANMAAVRAIRYTDAIAKHDVDIMALDTVTMVAA